MQYAEPTTVSHIVAIERLNVRWRQVARIVLLYVFLEVSTLLSFAFGAPQA
jgi:hypothetical protein